MEALLNTVWFLFAVGAVVASIWRAPRDRRHYLLEWVALLCAAVLLFPIISITDDLQAEVFVVEDSITKQMTSGPGYSSRIISELGGVAIVLVAPLSAILCYRSWRSSEEMSDSYSGRPEHRLSLDRSPPWLSA